MEASRFATNSTQVCTQSNTIVGLTTYEKLDIFDIFEYEANTSTNTVNVWEGNRGILITDVDYGGKMVQDTMIGHRSD